MWKENLKKEVEKIESREQLYRDLIDQKQNIYTKKVNPPEIQKGIDFFEKVQPWCDFWKGIERKEGITVNFAYKKFPEVGKNYVPVSYTIKDAPSVFEFLGLENKMNTFVQNYYKITDQFQELSDWCFKNREKISDPSNKNLADQIEAEQNKNVKQKVKRLKKKILKKISILTIFFIIAIFSANLTFAEPLPVSTSYDDVINSAKKINNESVETTTKPNSLQNQENEINTKTVNISKSTDSQDVQKISNQVKKDAKNIKTKQDIKILNLILKFILAMIWVIISSIIIFILLISYKKLILKDNRQNITYENTAQSLDTPKNFKDALKLFLDKTKWY